MNKWVIFLCIIATFCLPPQKNLRAQTYQICRSCHQYPCQCAAGHSIPPTSYAPQNPSYITPQPDCQPNPPPPTTCAPYPYNTPPCKQCGPYPGYYPSAPVCGTACGVSYKSMFIAVALVVGVAAIILSVGEGLHSHNPLVLD